MIKLFRNFRKAMLKENRFSKYFFYAIGEVILVVIGILIALKVNNWNLSRIEKKKEIKYLNNIVLDLQKDIARLNYVILFREKRIAGDRKIINHINGLPVDDLTELTRSVFNSLMEERFTPNNNTYMELSNSGNLSLISSDSIKMALLELEDLYKNNRFAIDHETWDYREYISKPILKHMNLDQLFPVFAGTKTAEEQNISQHDFQTLFENKEYKNGLFIVLTMSDYFIKAYREIDVKSKKVIDLIEAEIQKK